MRSLHLAIASIALAATAATATAAGIDPVRDFEVDLKQMPKIETTGNDDVVLTGVRLAGTVSERSGGRTGSFDATCDLELHVRTTETTAHASGSERCGWSMVFSDGTLVGTLEGQNEVNMSLESGGSATGKATVTVVAGTGVFAGKVGSGTFTQNEQIPKPGVPTRPQTPPNPPPGNPPPGNPPPGTPTPPPGTQQPGVCVVSEAPPPGTPLPPGCTSLVVRPPDAVPRALASIAAKVSRMKVRLRDGEAGARIAAPGPKLNKQNDPGLRVVTAPGATCSALAVKGAGERKVELGSAGDPNRDGRVTLVAKLRPKLDPGTWTLTAVCKTADGDVVARRTIRVA